SCADAYGLLKSALREEGPVVFIDHKKLFPTSGEVPVKDATVPIGRARILRQGDKVTLTTHSYMTRIAMEAAERLEEAGIGVEVIDLVSLAPLDIETVSASVARTGALVTLEEGQLACGVGTEVAYQVSEKLGPVITRRIGPRAAPVSSNPLLEAATLPNAETVISTITKLLEPGN
ncbi:MAG: pyruvate dehydrogenase complex E1 component subunit beta, partial [Sphingomonadaceae bacterium]|nr:pyruvate dehydrogenase complex E1 component subunit beta [Sphingomonadaceae bacterium]